LHAVGERLGDPSTVAQSTPSTAASGFQLFVMANESFTVHALPRRGVVVLGRSEGVDVLVDDPHVSRRHAQLHIGETIEVEDLAGINGTFVRGQRVPAGLRIPIAPGEAVGLGDTLFVVQPRSERSNRAAHSQDVGETESLLRRVPPDIIVVDDLMRKLYALAVMAAPSPINMLVLGETGVGKELLAQTIHACSERKNGPLVSLNCATFAENLLETELFGHERGAFTGALQAKPGLFETAAGGTVFLDEIGEMAPIVQARLLRVLETREVRRLGALKARPVDMRIVAATNRDLAAEVHRGTFRKDLYFRLSGLTLHVPPLRERPSEIGPLAVRFLRSATRTSGLGRELRLTSSALERLERHAWPGNVRELRNVIERSALLCRLGDVRPEHLLFDEMWREGDPTPQARSRDVAVPREEPDPIFHPDPSPSASHSDRGIKAEMAAIERRRIAEALEKFGGNQTRTAKFLKISRRTLLKRLDSYGSSRPRKDRPRA
jgi:two-component system, NtrC family, response regulator AtoC